MSDNPDKQWPIPIAVVSWFDFDWELCESCVHHDALGHCSIPDEPWAEALRVEYSCALGASYFYCGYYRERHESQTTIEDTARTVCLEGDGNV